MLNNRSEVVFSKVKILLCIVFLIGMIFTFLITFTTISKNHDPAGVISISEILQDIEASVARLNLHVRPRPGVFLL